MNFDFPKKLSPQEFRVFTDILIAASQVTFGVAFATFFLPPLDSPKQFAIIVSSILTVVLWILAWIIGRRIKL